jgi:D-glycero-D-manno-heptose 1,7-bisphosphate phosphatase
MAFMRRVAWEVELDAMYYPFHPEHGVGKYKQEHEDRKPGTGMLRRGAQGLSGAGRGVLGRSMFGCGGSKRSWTAASILDLRHETEGCGGEYLAVKSLAEVERWLVERG